MQTIKQEDEKLFSLKGRLAFVTGSAAGLGAAIAIRLAQHGADVIISDLPGQETETTTTLAKQYGGRVGNVPLDVTATKEIAAKIADAEKEWGPIDILVNNAGINLPASGLEVEEASWDKQFAINVKGAFFATQAVAGGMVSRGYGRVIFVASQSGLVGIPGQPAYCATKGAVIQLARTLAVEWASHGVTVNAVAPTFVQTALTQRRLEDADYHRYVMGNIPTKRLAQPEEIGAAVAYLASNEAAMVNGAVLSVDGGWTAW